MKGDLWKTIFRLASGGIILLFSSGCGIGYRTVVFTTQSNMGVDLDTQPPATQINISRKEVVIEPQFEEGKTLPVLASFRSKTLGVLRLFSGVSSSFATGRAAAVMSRLYEDQTPTIWRTDIQDKNSDESKQPEDAKKKVESDQTSTSAKRAPKLGLEGSGKESSKLMQGGKVKAPDQKEGDDSNPIERVKKGQEYLEQIYPGLFINNRPWRKGAWWFLPFLPKKDSVLVPDDDISLLDKVSYRSRRKIEFMEAGEVRPVVFNTDTNLGLKVNWNGSTGQYPSSVKFGYNRKELAYTPVTLSINTDTEEDAIPGEDSVPGQSTDPGGEGEGRYKVNIASLLATTGTQVNTGESQQTGLNHYQYFATGAAADNLSMRKEVREVFSDIIVPPDVLERREFPPAVFGPYLEKEKKEAIKWIEKAKSVGETDVISHACKLVWDLGKDETGNISMDDTKKLINNIKNENSLDKLRDFIRIVKDPIERIEQEKKDEK